MVLTHRSLVRLEKQSMKFRSGSVLSLFDVSSDPESPGQSERASAELDGGKCSWCGCLCDKYTKGREGRAGFLTRRQSSQSNSDYRPSPLKSTQLARQSYFYVGGMYRLETHERCVRCRSTQPIPTGLYLSYGPVLVGLLFKQITDRVPYGVLLAVTILGPAQGFFNCLAYLVSSVVSLLRECHESLFESHFVPEASLLESKGGSTSASFERRSSQSSCREYDTGSFRSS